MRLAPPRLVGIFTRAAQWQRHDPAEPDVAEFVRVIGVDVDGNLWGLVERRGGKTDGFDRWIPVGNPAAGAMRTPAFPEDSDETDMIDPCGRWLPPVRPSDE